MQNLSSRQTSGLIVVLGIIGLSVLIAVWQSTTAANAPAPITFHEAGASPSTVAAPAPTATSISPVSTTPPTATDNVQIPPASGEIVVHVTGAVKRPGVYHLPTGARGEDALKAAGGPKPGAATDALNLAARLQDETQLHVPGRGEASRPAPATTPRPDLVVVGTRSAAPARAAPTHAKSSRSSSRSNSSSRSGNKFSTPGEGTVNINTASAEELQRLPGIGPAMAERVIAYRQENGRFSVPEDLLQVSGIGPKKFAKMQPFVRVR